MYLLIQFSRTSPENSVVYNLVSVPDPKPTPARIAFSIAGVILEVIYTPDEVWGLDYVQS